MLTANEPEHAGGYAAEREGQVPTVLRKALQGRWEFNVADGLIEIQHAHRASPYRPPRHSPSWAELLDGLRVGFAAQGAPQDTCLPLRWGRETELTISAVQALDPLLKEGQPYTYRSGFLPQPVVRLTGKRETSGDLSEGFLTSFVNISRVQPIQDIDEYGTIFDGWLSVLSQLGFHARHVSVYGRLSVWHRRQVHGLTLHFRHLDLPLGDIVLLWNAENPERMAVDLGTGLERLAWARTRMSWNRLVHGRFAEAAPTNTLDAIRTATLLLSHGITPTGRGPGGITRRTIAAIATDSARLGISALVRDSYNYWSMFAKPSLPWPAVATAIEEELRL